jgi:tetratricopeptide (TPR) repeat protein
MFERTPKLEKVSRRFPQAPLFARLADQYLRQGRLMRAQALCEEGCERFPAYPTGFFVLSRCFEQQKMWEEARSALDRGLRLDPDNPAGYRRLGHIYRQIGNDTLALKCLERSAALDPLSEGLAAELEQMAASAQQLQSPEPAQPPAPVVTDAEPPQQPAAETKLAPEPVDNGSVGLSDDADEADEEDVVSSETGEEALSEEPFGQVQTQPEWEDSGEEAVEAEVGLVGEPAVDFDEPAPIQPDPASVSNDEVAALGEGLFEDDEEPAEPQPQRVTAAEPLRPDPSKPPVEKTKLPELVMWPVETTREEEAEPLPVELLDAEDELEPETPATDRVTELGVARLAGRHGDEFADLLQDSDPIDRDSTEDTEELAEPVATVTLGELYLSQGYHEQALEIYQRVLHTDPDNEAARRGADELST